MMGVGWKGEFCGFIGREEQSSGFVAWKTSEKQRSEMKLSKEVTLAALDVTVSG